MKRFTVLFAFFVFLGLQSLLAQPMRISGKVTGADDGSALPGVSVVVKGTTIGTVTDVNGNYELQVPQDATTLVFSFVGMKTQEVSISGQSNISFTMTSDALAIGEVVVTAIGLRRDQKSLGYSATTVNSETFENSSQINAMNALQGKIAGVEVTSGGGAPGASTKVIIRGYSSLAANNPLYVIDGVPINNAYRTIPSGTDADGLDFGNRANDINPNDIESMTILKGAAATALYGSKAANGAVIIQTKKGMTSQKMKVEVNSSVSVSDVLRLPQMQNIFGQGWSGHWAVDENGSWGPKMDGSIRAWGNVIDGAQKIKPFAPVKDNMYEFYDYGTQFNNSISLSGGNEKTTYYASYQNVSADGVIPNDLDTNNKNIIMLSAKNAGKRLTASTTINYVNNKGSLNPDGIGGTNAAANIYSEILQIPRDFSIVDLADYKNDPYNTLDYYFTPYAANPYFAINENLSEFFENRVYGNLELEYKFFEWLSATWRMGADVAGFSRKEWEAIMQFSPGTPHFGVQTPNPGKVYELSTSTRQYNSDFLFQYNKRLSDDFVLDGVVGYNVNSYAYKSLDGEITSLVIPEFYDLSNTDGKKETTTNIVEKRQYAYYATANVSFRDYAYLTLSGRQEYSSTLPKDANSYFYPAVSASLLVSELIPSIQDYAQLIKVRASYGLAGNDAPPYYLDPYFASSVVVIPYSELIFPISGVGAFEKGNLIGNPNLKPEITTEKEIGADIRLFESRIMLDIAYYNRVSDGQILSVNIPPSSGFTTQVVNFGKVENKGIELVATVVPVRTTNFEWGLTTTYTKNNNKVLELPGGDEDTPGEQILTGFTNYGIEMVAIEGKPIGILRAPDYERDDAGHIIVNSSSGLPISTADYSEAGCVLPNYMLGITNNLRYKDFNLSFLLDYRNGGFLWSGTADLHYFVGNATQSTYNNRQPWIVPNSVKANPVYVDEETTPDEPEYVENDIPITMVNVNAYYYHTNNQRAIRDRIVPKDYLKLRDVTLSYNLPSKFISKLPIEKLSVVVSGRNLLLFTPKENNFIDPESTSYGNDLISEFGEFRTGPTLRSFTGGIRIIF